MSKDPVCGMQVDENTAKMKSSYKGENYVFCSKQCKDKFDHNPDRYAHHEEPVTK